MCRARAFWRRGAPAMWAATGRKEDAATQQLESIRSDRKWNDEAARKQLIKFFDAWGPKDKATLRGRRLLSGLLFS